MNAVRLVLLAVLLITIVGCYAAKIETGNPASETVIKQSFASCWIFGLVPPSTVEAAAQCPNGVARVETKHTFVNGLVTMLTFGIYTPMEITVTCAEETSTSLIGPPADIIMPPGASPEEIQEVFALAADQAAESGEPVYVQLGQQE